MFYRKKKAVWEEPTQTCWDHWALTSASSSKIYSDLPVFSGFLSVKEKLVSWGVWSATVDLFIIFTLLSCGIHKIFYVKLKEISAANFTNVLHHVPKSASHERPRTKVAWRKIKPEWQKHPEFQRHMKTNLTKKMIFTWGYLPKSRIMHVPMQIPPTLYFLHLH